MNKHGSFIEYLHAVQIKDLLGAFCINSLGRVKDERQVRWGMVEVVQEVWIHRK